MPDISLMRGLARGDDDSSVSALAALIADLRLELASKDAKLKEFEGHAMKLEAAVTHRDAVIAQLASSRKLVFEECHRACVSNQAELRQMQDALHRVSRQLQRERREHASRINELRRNSSSGAAIAIGIAPPPCKQGGILPGTTTGTATTTTTKSTTSTLGGLQRGRNVTASKLLLGTPLDDDVIDQDHSSGSDGWGSPHSSDSDIDELLAASGLALDDEHVTAIDEDHVPCTPQRYGQSTTSSLHSHHLSMSPCGGVGVSVGDDVTASAEEVDFLTW